MLDGTDLEIVALLEQDSRRPLADIGRQVSLSAPAVKRRMDRLEQLGVITGYTITIDHAKLGWPLGAFCELRFAGTTRSTTSPASPRTSAKSAPSSPPQATRTRSSGCASKMLTT